MVRKYSTLVRFTVVFLQTVFLLIISDASPQIRIINGQNGHIKDFPYQLSLRKHSKHICGGAILDPKWALTAAHCMHGQESSPDIYTLRIGSSLRSIGGEVITISRILIHPLYNDVTMNFDVALLRTKPNKLRGDFVHQIRLPDVSAPIIANIPAKISGWGHMSSSEYSLSNTLKYATVYTVQQAECNRNLRYQGGITDAMFCAAARQIDACQGDSGGPITMNDTLIGLVSWGVGCADPHYPGVYTRLAYPSIRLWIRLLTRL